MKSKNKKLILSHIDLLKKKRKRDRESSELENYYKIKE